MNSKLGRDAARPPRWLQIAGGLVAVALLAAIGVQLSSSWGELSDKLVAVSPWHAVAALLLTVLAEALVGVAWAFGMAALGGRPTVLGAIAVHFVASLGRAAPGMVATAAGRVSLANRANVARKTAGAGMLLELLLSATAGALLGVAAMASAGVLSSMAGRLPSVWIVLGGVAVVVVGLVAVRWLTRAVASRWEIGVQKPRPRAIAALLAIYGATWAVYGFAVKVVSESAGIALPAFWVVGGLFALAWLIGFAAFFVPGGLGVREGALVALLAPVIPASDAALVAILGRLIWWLATLVISAVGAAWLWTQRDRREARQQLSAQE